MNAVIGAGIIGLAYVASVLGYIQFMFWIGLVLIISGTFLKVSESHEERRVSRESGASEDVLDSSESVEHSKFSQWTSYAICHNGLDVIKLFKIKQKLQK